ncbi:hypothetical protein A6B38_00180 [Bartonella bacilliformis]|nr:hypothetical protein BbINS_00825 [Bartonella bacilliformis INS]KZM38111.1 hypothetical protein AWH67_00350 [Bartonella bacilliformis]KZN22126.1 hypothetical protein A6B38_00180 [Bartonella bacilliformis]
MENMQSKGYKGAREGFVNAERISLFIIFMLFFYKFSLQGGRKVSVKGRRKRARLDLNKICFRFSLDLFSVLSYGREALFILCCWPLIVKGQKIQLQYNRDIVKETIKTMQMMRVQ